MRGNSQASVISEGGDYVEFCEERLQNPFPLFHRLQESDPVHWCEPMKLWLVTRYEDVMAGLREPRFSSNRTDMYIQVLPDELKTRVQPLLDHVSKWLQLTDEPAHGRLRKLVNLAFTPKMVQALRPKIEGFIEALLDDVGCGEPFDIIERFTCALPATVICELLGIPLTERHAFRRLTEQIMLFSTGGGPKLKNYAASAEEALGELTAMFDRLIAERRNHPQPDLLTALAQAEAGGERLSKEELHAMCVFIFLAGHDTTNNGIASGLLALMQHPDQFELLRRDVDGRVRGAVEEVLRYESPVTRAVRQAREDLIFRGKGIRRGQLVVHLLGAANRDPAIFADPDRFDITRQPTSHLAFGNGSHFCLGAFLARLEMELAFRAVIRRLPNLRLASEPLVWRRTMGIRALERLMVLA